MAVDSVTVDSVTEYAQNVVAGKKQKCCKAEYLACKRHLNDLKRSDLEWHPELAEKHIQFAEMLKVYDKNAKKYIKVKLRGFQKFIIGSVFGWYKNGIRRFNENFIQMARKNGKSFLNAYFCLDFSSISGIKDAQIYCCGTNYLNASIVWNDFKKLVEADKNLSKYYTIKDYQDSRSRIINNKNGSIIKPLAGDGSGEKDGFCSYYCTLDEYHLHQDTKIYDAMNDSRVGLHGSMLSVITTAGKDLGSPCYQQYKYAKEVLSGVIEADTLFVFIAELDLPDPHKDQGKPYYDALWNKENWCMANPYLLYDDDYNVTTDVNKWRDFEDAGNKAKREEGATLNNFLIKKLDIWTTLGSEKYINIDDWSACGTEPADIMGKTCFIGLDLSTKNDLATYSAYFPAQAGLNLPYIYSHSFLPKDTLQRHILQDKFAYDRAELNGYLTLTDCDGTNGYIVDNNAIARHLKAFIKDNKLSVKFIGYDAMGIGGIMSLITDIPCEKIEILQTPKSMNEATRHFKGVVEARQISYDKKNELLSKSVVNAVAVVNSKQELLIDKQRHGKYRRIDPVDALLDAYKCWLLTCNEESQADKDTQIVDEWLSLMENL